MRFHPHPISEDMQTSMPISKAYADEHDFFISPRHTPSAPVQAEIQSRGPKCLAFGEVAGLRYRSEFLDPDWGPVGRFVNVFYVPLPRRWRKIR